MCNRLLTNLSFVFLAIFTASHFNFTYAGGIKNYKIKSSDRYFSTKVKSKKKPYIRYDKKNNIYSFHIHVSSPIPIQCFLSREYLHPSYWIKTVTGELENISNYIYFYNPQISTINDFPYINLLLRYRPEKELQKSNEVDTGLVRIVSIDLLENTVLCIHDDSIPNKRFIKHISFLEKNLNIKKRKIKFSNSFKKLYYIKNKNEKAIGYTLQYQKQFGNYRIFEENHNEIIISQDHARVQQISFSDTLHSDLNGEILESKHSHYKNNQLIYESTLKRTEEKKYTIEYSTNKNANANKRKRKNLKNKITKKNLKKEKKVYTEIPIIDRMREIKIRKMWLKNHKEESPIKIIKYMPQYSDNMTFLKINYIDKKSDFDFYIGDSVYGKLKLDKNAEIVNLSIQKPSQQLKTFELQFNKKIKE